MLNFTFQNTTKIHFGEGQIAKIAKEIPKDKKVLMLYGGGSIKNNGVYQQVADALAGHQWSEFSGIEPNPKYDTLMKAVKQIQEEGIEYLLAVGGGSVIDGVKFISVAVPYITERMIENAQAENNDPWNILTQRAKTSSALPIGCVLTLPATGSETNTGAVVTRDGDKLAFASPFVRPLFAVLDPQVTTSLSERQTANGVVDAFVHTMEQYLTYPVDGKIQDRFAEGILHTLIEEGPRVLAEPDNIDVRGNVMWAATQALNGLIGAGVPQDWATHMIGHELTAKYELDHGRTLAIVLPAVMKLKREQKREKLLQYAARIWSIDTSNEDQAIDLAIAKTEEFFKQMGMPVRLADADIPATDIPELIEKLTAHGMVVLGEHRDITPEESRKIFELAK